MDKELSAAHDRFRSEAQAIKTNSRSYSALEAAINLYSEELYRNNEINAVPSICNTEGTYNRSYWKINGWIVEEHVGEDDEDLGNLDLKILIGDYNSSNEYKNILSKDVQSSLKKALNFLKKAMGEKSLEGDTEEANELQDLIHEKFKSDHLGNIEIIYLTNFQINKDKISLDFKTDFDVSFSLWDLMDYSILKRSEHARIPVDIDFIRDKDFSDYQINAVEVPQEGIKNFLAAAPGYFIADLYKHYHTRILQRNVRLFLSGARKANKSMVETIRDKPTSFLAFNNGLSVTASKIELKEGRIVRINDMQIVNGGQTTATLHRVTKLKYKDSDNVSRSYDLTDVKVAIKFTEISSNKKDDYGALVENISKAANTQSAVKDSDFFSSKLLFVEAENYSKRLPTKFDGNTCYLFFERMTGQYKTSIGRGFKSDQRKFESQYPAKLSFDKVEFTRWHTTMHSSLAFQSASSAQKQFRLYMNGTLKVNGDPIRLENVSESKYKQIVGFGLLFKRFRQIVGKKNRVKYPPLINTSIGMSTTIYACAALHKLTDGLLDYWSIYDGKFNVAKSVKIGDGTYVETPFDDDIKKLIITSATLLEEIGGGSAQERSKLKETQTSFYAKFNLTINDLKSFKSIILTQDEIDERLTESVLSNNLLFSYFKNVDKMFSENSRRIRSTERYIKMDTEKFSSTNFRRLVGRYAKIAKDGGISTIKNADLEILGRMCDYYESQGLTNEDESIEESDFWSPKFDNAFKILQGIQQAEFENAMYDFSDKLKESDQEEFVKMIDDIRINPNMTRMDIDRLLHFFEAKA